MSLYHLVRGLTGLLAAASILHAQSRDTTRLDDLVVTATRTPTAPRALGSAADRFKPEELARRQLTSLREALQLVPGGATFVTGGPGGVTSLFLRGAASTQTLLLVDGIRINDANLNTGSFLGGADLAGLGRLEVVRGPQSTLYGGAAIGGVVALDAVRGTGLPRGGATIEGGSFGTWRGTVTAEGARGGLGFTTAFSANGTDNQRRPNGWEQRTQLVRLDRARSARLQIGATFRGLQQSYESPGDIRTTNSTPADRTIHETNLGTVFVEAGPAAGWRSRLVAGVEEAFTRNTSRFDGSPEFVFALTNHRYVLDWQNTVALPADLRLVAGVNREWSTVETGGASREERLLGLYAETEAAPVASLHLTGGVRQDDYTTFGRKATWRVTGAWTPGTSGTKLRASLGTGFMPPSLDARYGSVFQQPNAGIRPERSRGWDAGVDQSLRGGRAGLSATWFSNSFRDLIGFRSAAYPTLGQSVNIDRAHTSGLELSGHLTAGILEARAAYTWLRARSLSASDPSEERLIRRPGQSLSADLVVTASARGTLGGGLVVVGDRRDSDFNQFPAARVDPGNYAVARVYGAWESGPRLTLRARVDNLLGARYEPVYGFPALGRNFTASLAVQF